MKSYRFLPLVAVLILTAPVAYAQKAGGGPGHQHQQFEQMDRMLDEAQKLRGKARRDKMMEHVQMMRGQTRVMHGMMDDMTEKDSAGGKKAPGDRRADQMGDGNAQMMQRMQGRLDMMQMMMEQMQKQQEMMLKDDD